MGRGFRATVSIAVGVKRVVLSVFGILTRAAVMLR